MAYSKTSALGISNNFSSIRTNIDMLEPYVKSLKNSEASAILISLKQNVNKLKESVNELIK